MTLNQAQSPENDQQVDRIDTATRILDVAERLVQLRGFNGFSYADIAAELHITKASLHYHYAGKADLGRALIERYAERFTRALESIDQHETDPVAKIRAYAAIYADVLSERRMCLCGMLAAGYDTLAEPMQQAVIEFFDANEAWLTRVLEQGQESGRITLNGPAREAAQVIVSSLEGAMLIARPYNDVERFNAAATRLLTGLVS
ncbi:MAG TPA: TetR/AcrR family transcriptional regulator [Propionibacteriaceae bacterium]|jgi:TetR/AcrR family transcriptional repressor of nem operon|nr:TetR/AcrR family transcriptional regulator [Propionibacteriaceae bacterium]